jgi:hypothetical protein
MRYLWGLLCDKVIADKYTNTLSLITIPEGFTIDKRLPLGESELELGTFFVATFWRGVDDDPLTEMQLSLRHPNGGGGEIIVETIGDKVTHVNASESIVVGIQSLRVNGSGLYHIDIALRRPGAKKWRRVASHPFILRLAPSLEATSPVLPSEPTPSAPPASS